MKTYSINKKILTPLTDNPVGVDLRHHEQFHSVYFTLKNSRRQARESDKKHSHNNQYHNSKEDWNKLATQAEDVLTTTSKDLEIACWVLEAWTHIDGLTGFHNGIILIANLLKQFWPNCYPIDKNKSSLQPLANLNGTSRPGGLIDALNNISVFSYADTDYKKNDLQLIFKQGNEEEKRQLMSAAEQRGAHYFIQLEDLINSTLCEFEKLCQWIDHVNEEASIPTSYITNNLNEWATLLTWIKSSFAETATAEIEEPSIETDNRPPEVKPSNVTLNKTNRQQAFKHIRNAANYFLSHEPHSPVAYLLEKAIRWGDMSLPDLINEMVEDQNTRDEIFKLTGINQ